MEVQEVAEVPEVVEKMILQLTVETALLEEAQVDVNKMIPAVVKEQVEMVQVP